MIIKDIFKVTGSQATNIGWINLGNGDYRWYVKGEQDTRQRFLDKREMMMLVRSEIQCILILVLTGQQGDGYRYRWWFRRLLLRY